MDCLAESKRPVHGLKKARPKEKGKDKDKDKKETEPNQTMLEHLYGMGFPINDCRTALAAVKNESEEEAIKWMEEHLTRQEPCKIPLVWQCTVCTFVNQNANPSCEVCHAFYVEPECLPEPPEEEGSPDPFLSAPPAGQYQASEQLSRPAGRVLLMRARKGVTPLLLVGWFEDRLRVLQLGPTEQQLRGFCRL